jgi:hypothetical protein
MDNLPSDLFHLLAEYLNLSEILNLDSAITQNSIRHVFHQSLSFLPLFNEIKFPTAGIVWLYNRNIFIHHLHTRSFNSDALQYLTLIRSILREINLDQNRRMTDHDFIQIGSCPSLRSLSISMCNHISDKSLAIVLKANPQLEILQMSSIRSLSNNTIREITESCPNLSVLNLSKNRWVDDNTIGILITGCPLLKTIVLSDTSVGEASALNLLKTYPNLQSVEFVYCSISKTTAQRIMREIVMTSLQHPNLDAQMAGVSCLNATVLHCESTTFDFSISPWFS